MFDSATKTVKNVKYEDIYERAKHALRYSINILFPQSIYCICCGNIIDESRSYSLCDHCMEHIRWNSDDARMIDDMQVMRCVDYGIYERSIIFAMKYDNHRYIAREIGKIMRDRMIATEITSPHVVVPVPLHQNKRVTRGFNQSELIGRFLAKEMGWEMRDVLIRTRETKAMRGLGPEERSSNISGSISIKKEMIDLVRNKDIMLVDDFYTTGSTAGECMAALKGAQPRSVSFLAFAGREWKKLVKNT